MKNVQDIYIGYIAGYILFNILYYNTYAENEIKDL